jgi:DNA ligase-1
VTPATLQQFAHAKDAVAAVAGKLEKQRILAEYFRELGDDDLRLAVRFAAGRAFPATDERVLAAGGAIVWDVLLQILPIDHDELRRLTISSGEIGEAISKVWPPREVERPLLLADLEQAFDDLAATGVQNKKREILLDLFGRCATGREATYLAKIIFRDMRTGAQEGIIQAAVAQAFDRKPADVQKCQLLVGNLEEVALLARQDELGCAAFRLFHPIQFMLATPQETPADAEKTMDGRPFFVEDKLDGIRAQVHKQGDRVAIYTRTMDRTDDSFPEDVEAMKHIDGDFLIDGEIVPFAAGAVSPFQHLQRRLGRKAPTEGVLKKYPVAIIAFDLLYENGELLMDLALRERRVRLEALAERTPASAGWRLNVTDSHEVRTVAEIAAAFEASKNRRNEGLILKDPESVYSPGRRGQMWLKLKTHLPTLDCVVTAAEYGHGRRRNSLSDYTFAVWRGDPNNGDAAELVNIGKAYSGVTDAEIAELTALFKSIAIADNGRVFQVRPQVVMEIAFDQVQRSARHASGFAMRFPRIKDIRRDKRPEDADRIERVEEIYQSAANTSRDAGDVGDDVTDVPAEAKPAKRKVRKQATPEPTLNDHLP